MDNQTQIKQLTSHFKNEQLKISEYNGALVVTTGNKDIFALCELLKRTLQYDYLQFLTCIDRTDKLELQYFLYSYTHKGTIIIKTDLERSGAKIKSVSSVWKTADWHEREAYDLFGVVFEGHPELRRILLEDDFQGHPLLKDFSSDKMVRLPKV